MNLFDYEGKEFDKKLDEIFKNKDKEELKQELIECGLEINNSNRLKYLMKKIDKIVENMSIEEIEKRIKVDEMEEDLKVLEKELANIRNLIEYYTFESLDYDKKFRMERFEKAIKNLIKGYKDLEEKVNKYEKQIDLEFIEENYIEKSKVKEARNKFDEMVQKMYARKKEITDHDVFILFDELLEGDDK